MIWKSIKGFHNYMVSSTGLILSRQRRVRRTLSNGTFHYKIVRERILKPALTVCGYYFVCLRKNNRHYNVRVHITVAAHFKGRKPNGLIVCHANDIKTDNNESNLYYGSKSHNTQKYYNSIGKCYGKVPINDIPEIIQSISKGKQISQIADKYNVRRNDIAVLNKIISLSKIKL